MGITCGKKTLHLSQLWFHSSPLTSHPILHRCPALAWPALAASSIASIKSQHEYIPAEQAYKMCSYWIMRAWKINECLALLRPLLDCLSFCLSVSLSLSFVSLCVCVCPANSLSQRIWRTIKIKNSYALATCTGHAKCLTSLTQITTTTHTHTTHTHTIHNTNIHVHTHNLF